MGCAKRIALDAYVRQYARTYHPQHAVLVGCEVAVGVNAPAGTPVNERVHVARDGSTTDVVLVNLQTHHIFVANRPRP
eukprot:5769153-Pyramimonas_sp.AAC.1